MRLLRKGKTFWQMLGERGLRSTIFRMPVNFPPVKALGRSLSGMGTPDLLGSQGTFSFYTNQRKDWPAQVSGRDLRGDGHQQPRQRAAPRAAQHVPPLPARKASRAPGEGPGGLARKCTTRQ